MALINCPECNKEISDKVQACPHCGYPLVEEVVNQEIQKNDIAEQKARKNKKIIVVLLFVIIIGVGLIVRNNMIKSQQAIAEQNLAKQKEVEYIEKVVLVSDIILERAADAEYVCNIVYKVWNASIFENANNDFNTNISYLYSGNQYKDYKYVAYNNGYDIYTYAKVSNYEVETLRLKVKSIKDNESNLVTQIKELQDYPEKYKGIYDEVLKLYEIYQGLSNQALNPTGNLTSYSSDVNSKIELFTTQLKKIQVLLPDNIES